MAVNKDIKYHSKSNVVSTYDLRITNAYYFEHKYLTLFKWLNVLQKEGKCLLLDFGSGTGNVSYNALKYKLTPVSLDTSLEMLKAVREKTKNMFLGVRGDGERLPFKSEVFDAVICMGVIHHLENKENALKEMCRVIKKDGYIFIAEPRKSDSFVFSIYDKLLLVPRYFKNIFLRLGALETEKPLEDFDLNIIKNVVKECGKTARIRQYLYLPYIFRILPDFFQRKFFKLLNLHIKFNENFDIVSYNNPKRKLNIIEIVIR